MLALLSLSFFTFAVAREAVFLVGLAAYNLKQNGILIIIIIIIVDTNEDH